MRNVNYFIELTKNQNNNNDQNNNNNNNNNNDSATINYNEQNASSANGSFEKDLHGLSGSNTEHTMNGAASLALQTSLQCLTTTSTSLSSLSPPSLSSSMNGSHGSQKIGIRHTFDGIDAITSSSLNNSTQSDLDARFALNSTKIVSHESFESSHNTSAQNAFELNSNIMPSVDASINGMMKHRESK